jgi:Peptidase propeptide and YPEB domain
MTRTFRQFIVIVMAILLSGSVIHAQSGGSVLPESKPRVGVLSEEVVRARLSAAGYGEIRSIQREEQHYLIETVRDGHPVRVKVDAMTGQISEEYR